MKPRRFEELPLPCQRKRRYNTYERAVAMAVYRTAQEDGPDALKAYKCHLCGGFHLTKKLDGRNAAQYPAIARDDSQENSQNSQDAAAA